MSDLFGLLAFGADGWGDEIAAGTWLTIRLAVATLPFGLALGFLIALGSRSAEPVMRAACGIFTTIFRGLPELLTLFLVYYGGQILLQNAWVLVSSGTIEISGFLAGVIALGLVFAAYASEVFIAAFNGIPTGQGDAGRALGLSRFAAMRLIILPQLVRLALPGLSNLWLVHLKATALVSVIALDDLMRKTTIIVGNTKEPFFFFAIACVLYLIMAAVSSFGLGLVETWTRRSEAQR